MATTEADLFAGVIREALALTGMRQAQLARAIGTTQGTLNRWKEAKHEPKRANRVLASLREVIDRAKPDCPRKTEIIRRLDLLLKPSNANIIHGASVQMPIVEHGSNVTVLSGRRPSHQFPDDAVVEMEPKGDAVAGVPVGASFMLGAIMQVADLPLKADHWRFPTEFQELVGVQGTKALTVVRAGNDDMAPTIKIGDRVCIDRSQLSPSRPGIYALLNAWSEVYFRRVMMTREEAEPGTVRLISDNPARPEPVDILAEKLRFVGRVVAVVQPQI